MHSSRMRTVRRSNRLPCQRGVCPGRGGCLPREGGVPARWGVRPWGCRPGVVPSGAGACQGGLCFSACWDAPPRQASSPPWTEWQTCVKTLPCRNFWMVIRKTQLKTWIESSSISCVVLCVFQRAMRRWKFRSCHWSGTVSGSRASVRGSSPLPPASSFTTSARDTWTRAPGRPASGPVPCRSTKQPVYCDIVTLF